MLHFPAFVTAKRVARHRIVDMKQMQRLGVAKPVSHRGRAFEVREHDCAKGRIDGDDGIRARGFRGGRIRHPAQEGFDNGRIDFDDFIAVHRHALRRGSS